jgi:BioD-like phosphotransacetylase family protein
VIPHQSILTTPPLSLILEELKAESLNRSNQLHNLVHAVVVGAMGVHNATRFLQRGLLLITPGDREDLILAVAASQEQPQVSQLAGMVLTDNLRPSPQVLQIIRALPFPVLLARDDVYQVASKVHDLTVKTRPDETEKIALIRDLIAKHIDIEKILKAL